MEIDEYINWNWGEQTLFLFEEQPNKKEYINYGELTSFEEQTSLEKSRSEYSMGYKSIEKDILEGHINFYDYEDFTDFEIIAKGRCGSVLKSTLKIYGLTVALKCLKDNEDNIQMHTENILIHDEKMMISDFGHSFHTNSDSIHKSDRILAFADPQSLKDPSYKFTKKIDIYSLGVILWEISSGQIPFENKSEKEIVSLVCQGKRETPINNMPLGYIELYKCCWDENPEIRPETVAIFEDLNKILREFMGSVEQSCIK
ncbi:kinase-like protein [Gigaspora margarita]|uniref:Kinase-like protein n=1 Tax=Gigaspora margarita TaxID=4874 RepID=A0A8H4ET64_GIGMA|nr:kinase-like protein [Gigaspora margarita]